MLMRYGRLSDASRLLATGLRQIARRAMGVASQARASRASLPIAELGLKARCAE